MRNKNKRSFLKKLFPNCGSRRLLAIGLTLIASLSLIILNGIKPMGNFLSASTADPPGCGNSENCLTVPDPDSFIGISKGGSLRESILKWVNFALGFLGLIAMIMIIFAGFLYVTSAGNQEQSDKAKKIIMYAALGIFVILISYVLVNALIHEAPTGEEAS